MSLHSNKTRGWIANFLRCSFLSYGMRLTVKITPAPLTRLWGEPYYACEHVLWTVHPHPFLLPCLLPGLSTHCFRIETQCSEKLFIFQSPPSPRLGLSGGRGPLPLLPEALPLLPQAHLCSTQQDCASGKALPALNSTCQRSAFSPRVVSDPQGLQ